MPLAVKQTAATGVRLTRWLLLVLVVGLFGSVTWGIFFPLEIRVVAPGEIIGDKSVVEIRAIESGVVRRFLVSNGATVRTGQVLVELLDEDLQHQKDTTEAKIKQLRCSVENAKAELDALAAHGNDIIRAIDSRDESALAPVIAYRAPCLDDHGAYRMRNLVDGLVLKLAQIRNRESDIRDLQQQIELTKSQIASLRKDVAAMSILAGKRLISDVQMRQLERQVDQARLNVANFRNRQANLRRNVVEIKKEAKADVSKHQRSLAQELRTDRLALNDEELKLGNIESRFLERTIRSPIDGTVIDVNSFVMANYAQKSELLMKLAPHSRLRHLKAKVALADIDNVNRDELARVRFSTDAQLRDILITAKIETINPIKLEGRSGDRTETYYEVTLRIVDSRYDPAKARLQSGVPAEILFAAERTTLAEALIRPITRNWPKIFEQ